MTIEKFKLPRSSYEQLCKIIKAYGQLKEPSPLGEVDRVCGIGGSNISANNPFLVAVGILEGGKQKVATATGRELGAALDHNMKEEIEAKWQQVINKNDFLSKMISAVRIRNGMGVSDLQSHIAYSSGESKAHYVMTGARAVLDMFKASGLVEEKDDRIIPKGKPAVDITEFTKFLEEKREVPFERPPLVLEEQKVDVGGSGKVIVSLNIQVKIEAKPSELDGLGEKLRGLIESLKEGTETKAGERQ